MESLIICMIYQHRSICEIIDMGGHVQKQKYDILLYKKGLNRLSSNSFKSFWPPVTFCGLIH